MKRFFSDRRSGHAPQELRDFAAALRPNGRAVLRLRAGTARRLQAELKRAAELNRPGAPADEALRRLNSEARRIEGCLRQAEAETGMRLPASGG